MRKSLPDSPRRIIKKYYSYCCLLMLFRIIFPISEGFSQKYFQQTVNYDIHVVLNDSRNELSGFESIEYINNSPDTLRFLYFHLWPNAYSSNETHLAKELLKRDGRSKLFNDPGLKGYIDSLNFKVNSESISWNLLEGYPDICKLIPAHPLKPGDTVLISTPFHVRIPAGGISRLGHTGQSYQISQWYPKPAVYDRKGWHQMPYLDQGEFYSEYGHFTVSITIPSNYIVGATGQLQNKQELEWLDKIAADTAWMRIPDYINESFPPSSQRLKTITYSENNIHDFAWFADKRFHVLKGHVSLPESGRKVTTLAMFTNKDAYLWKKSISYVNSALYYFSLWNGDYPYSNFTAVQSSLNAGDGMEYPELTVVSSAEDDYLLEEVLAHEICHSWFYSAIGSDERQYPFMDESITAANESRYMEMRYPSKKLWELTIGNRKIAKIFKADKIPVNRIQELEWLIPARINLEQPINLDATKYSADNYGSIIYSKAAIGFNYLRSYLGDSLYDAIMHDYLTRWKNKHPMPEDLRTVFESHTEKNLSWFFDDFLGTTRRLDYKVAGISNGKTLFKNKGELSAPLLIAELKNDSIISERWEDGFEGSKWINNSRSDFTEIKIDPDHKMTELFRLNNNLYTSGLFRKTDPFQIQLIYTIEDPSRRYLIYLPAFNWTQSDGFMAGAILHSGGMIPKPFEYFLTPFYSFRNQELTGFGRITFNSIPYSGLVRLASLKIEGDMFAALRNRNYHRGSAGLDLYLRSHNYINQKFYVTFIEASDLREIELDIPAKVNYYFQTGYTFEKYEVMDPFKADVFLEAGKSYQKASLELNYKLSYNGKKNGLFTRFFAGTMLEDKASDPFYSFSPDGRKGIEQYMYQGYYLARFSRFPSSFISRQMTISEGGLVSEISDSLGYSKWLVSLTFSSSLPWKASVLPIRPFADFLLNDHGLSGKNPELFVEAGIKGGIWDFFEVYFPFIASNNLDVIAGPLKNRIRFILRIDKFNLFTPKKHPGY